MSARNSNLYELKTTRSSKYKKMNKIVNAEG